MTISENQETGGEKFGHQGSASSDIVEKPVSFKAEDGYILRGKLLEPENPCVSLLLSSGTGFPHTYYLHCARYFAASGARVLVYDYRGIAESAPLNMAEMKMDYPDFGRLDMPAAANFLKSIDPTLEVVHLGHSVGGHMVGFMQNQELISRHAFVAVGSGYWAKHKLHYMPVALFFWWVFGPLSLLTKGYIAKNALWRGEALPKGVFTTWRRWCAQRNYYANELKTELKPHFFEAVESPIRSWCYSDDPIAGYETSQDILECYPNASSEIQARSPADYGIKEIGHAGMFRKHMSTLWDEWWEWLKP